jgi:3-hydroxyisobutyrate dehydrogenase
MTSPFYNRTAAKAERWVQAFGKHGGKQAATPALAAVDCDIVCACVGNDDDLRAVMTGPDGAFQHAAPGTIFVDHTTASASVARTARGRTSAAAISSMHPFRADRLAPNRHPDHHVRGDPEAFQRRARHRRLCPRRHPHRRERGRPVGQDGQPDQRRRLLQALEAIAFGEHAGLDMRVVLDVISKGAASSWQMENRGPTMLQNKFDFGFAVDWMRKDLGLCLDEARRNGATLPVTSLVDQFYADLQQMGSSRDDTSSLIKRLRRS